MSCGIWLRLVHSPAIGLMEITLYTNAPAAGLNSIPMKRKWCAPSLVKIVDELSGVTILGIEPALSGVTRAPSGRLSAALDRMTTSPVPDLLGNVKGPLKDAPA